MKNLNEFLNGLLLEGEVEDLKKKIDKVEKKAEDAEKAADDAEKAADDAEKEANKAEESIKDENLLETMLRINSRKYSVMILTRIK